MADTKTLVQVRDVHKYFTRAAASASTCCKA